jgi:glycosyltransferase involved in cell wall biosynthesis
LDTLERGGAERALIFIANGISRKTFQIHFIATRSPGPLATELAADVRVHSLDRTSRLNPASLRRFAAIIKENQIQIVHTHSHSAAYFAVLARALSRNRWLHVMHDHHGPIDASRLFQFLDRRFLPRADYYLAASHALAEYATRTIGIPADRVEVLPNCVAAPALRDRQESGTFTVVQVARFEPEKDQLFALRVASELKRRRLDFRWLIAGRTNTPYGRTCQRAAQGLGLSQHVQFLGEQRDVQPLLQSAHLGALTSRAEAMPLALLEYMAAGLPVVVTNVGDCGTLVTQSGGGVLVDRGNDQAFADAIAAFASDDQAAERAGMLNRSYVIQHHAIGELSTRVSRVYERLLQPVLSTVDSSSRQPPAS